MTQRDLDGSGWPRCPLSSKIGSTVPHAFFGSLTLRSIAGLVLLTTGAVGAHSSGAEAVHYSHTMVESSNCHGKHAGDGDHGHDDHAHDNGHNEHDNEGHDHHGHDGVNHGAGMLQQLISVRVRGTMFLRVDKSGRVVAAATNTGCRPSKQDDVFLLRPNGSIEPTTLLDIDKCDWTGDFSVPGRFQPQWCNAVLHRHRVDQFGSVGVESVVVVGS